MAKHLLSDRAVKNAKPKAKPYRLPDGENLYLYVAPSGVRSWQLRYRLGGKPQTATLGKYPKLSLGEARDEADKARKLLSEGKHFTVHKRLTKLQRVAADANTFEAVAAAWVKRQARRARWTDDYKREVEASLRNHLGRLNPLPLSEITAPMLAPILEAVEEDSPHMLEKVQPRLRAILNFAVVRGIMPGNPLPTPGRGEGARIQRRHFAAVTDLPGIGQILRDARAADPAKGIQRAHLMLAFTAQRISEIVGATWVEFDLKDGTWRIPRERMKLHKRLERGDHFVPLPKDLLASLTQWHRIDGAEDSDFVCPAPRDPSKPITPEAVEKHYRTALDLAGKHSPHAWRSAFSTICREAGKPADVIEAQLDHVVGNQVSAAYDRAKRLDLRRELMQWYEDQLIAARDGATVVQFRRATEPPARRVK